MDQFLDSLSTDQMVESLQIELDPFMTPSPLKTSPPLIPSNFRSHWRLERIVSGGQTGVDRAALDVAIELSIEHGGWCPRGRIAEDGTIPKSYRLKELDTSDYNQRTQRNVLDSDATLILYDGRMTGGTFLTKCYCEKLSKPSLCIAIKRPGPDRRVLAWLAEHHVRVLNIAGPRASKHPWIYDSAKRYLTRILTTALPDVAHF